MESLPLLALNVFPLNRIPALYPPFDRTELTQFIHSPHPRTPVPPVFIAFLFYFVYIVKK